MAEAQAPLLQVNTSPHVSDTGVTTRRMMLDVLIALLPASGVAVWVFGTPALGLILLCLVGCLLCEWGCALLLHRPLSLHDGSAAITGLILALSLPWSCPWHIALIGSAVAIVLGKMLFGGLGFNIFNPAMVGRAFIMLSFARFLGAPAYVDASGLDIVSQATPLTLAKEAVAGSGVSETTLAPLLLGTVNGSLGETSALALLLGGLFLCLRRSAAWEIPLAAILCTGLLAALAHAGGLTPLGAGHHLAAGSFLLGAFFIATDPVSSPLTRPGKLLYGALFGFFVVLLRLFSSYPEGVMFAVLLANACAPLLNRATIPQPLGGFAATPAR